MDNITHTLLGAIVGETAARCVPAAKALLPETTRRSLYVSLMVLGGNLPDLDAVYTGITGGKLGYLLHHRGHTHTVLGAVTIALLLYVLCTAGLRWRRIPFSAFDRWWLAFVALLAPLLHVAMDWTNEYGVHPFWPLNNAWFYGDRIFIIEPLFWACAAPLVFLARRRVARALVACVLLLGIGLSFGTGLVPNGLAAGLTLLTAALLLVGWRAAPRTAAWSGLVASLCVILVFTVSGSFAKSRVATLVANQYPDALALDHVLAPMPVNPLCWEVIALHLQGDAYTLRQAVFSLAPQWLPAEACPGPGTRVQTTVALAASAAPDSKELDWLDEVTLSRQQAIALLQGNCEALAFAGFARALWFRESADGWLVGDLRYDREPQLGFAEMVVAAEPLQCPRFVPPWIPPRGDLL